MAFLTLTLKRLSNSWCSHFSKWQWRYQHLQFFCGDGASLLEQLLPTSMGGCWQERREAECWFFIEEEDDWCEIAGLRVSNRLSFLSFFFFFCLAASSLSCPTACWLLVSRPGIEPTSPHGRQVLNRLTTREVCRLSFVFLGCRRCRDSQVTHTLAPTCAFSFFTGNQNGALSQVCGLSVCLQGFWRMRGSPERGQDKMTRQEEKPFKDNVLP